MTTKPTTKTTTRTTTKTKAIVPATTAAIVAAEPAAIVPATPTAELLPGNASTTAGFVRVMALALTRVAPMPVATIEDRNAVRLAITATLAGAYPATVNTGVRNSGMFSGLHVFEAQNAIYLAAALSGAYITDGHFVAAWAAELPNARCPYLARVAYPTSTLSEYLGNRHNQVPGVDGARDIVMAWHTAKRNRPEAVKA